MPINVILGDIAHERARQDREWGKAPHRFAYGPEWFVLMAGAFGEVALALQEGKAPQALRAGLIRVAAIAVAFVECIDAGYI